jgi:flagellar protein FlgJ
MSNTTREAEQSARSLQQQVKGTGAASGGEDQRLKEVAEEFEALFIEQMVKSMRQTKNPENDMLHGGMAENYFEDMLYQEYSKIMAKRGNFGIADMLYNQFSSGQSS